MSTGTPPPPPPDEQSPYGASGSEPAAAPPPPPPTGSSGEVPPAPGPVGPAPAYGGAPVTGPRPGELLDRFVARLIDLVLLGVVDAILAAVVVAGVLGLNGASAFGMGGSFAAGAVVAVLNSLVNLGYFAFMESSQGKTVGKMVMKLRVESGRGGNPSLEQAAKRNIWLAAPILGIVPIIGALAGSLVELVAIIMIAVGINNDAVRRRPWTDKFADTQVIKEG